MVTNIFLPDSKAWSFRWKNEIHTFVRINFAIHKWPSKITMDNFSSFNHNFLYNLLSSASRLCLSNIARTFSDCFAFFREPSCKGQLISKGIFKVFICTKKRMKMFFFVFLPYPIKEVKSNLRDFNKCWISMYLNFGFYILHFEKISYFSPWKSGWYMYYLGVHDIRITIHVLFTKISFFPN